MISVCERVSDVIDCDVVNTSALPLVFQVNLRLASFCPRVFSSTFFSGKEPLGINCTRDYGLVSFMSPNQWCQSYFLLYSESCKNKMYLLMKVVLFIHFHLISFKISNKGPDGHWYAAKSKNTYKIHIKIQYNTEKNKHKDKNKIILQWSEIYHD